MAVKTPIKFGEVAESEPHPYREPQVQDLILEIEGMTQRQDGTFVIINVPHVDIPYGKIEEILRAAGVESMDAMMLTEDFANRIATHTLAKVLAQRTKRVG